mgnify:CR=1 FL=1
MIEKSNTAIPVAEKQTTSSQIRFITITAMFIALTYVFTAFVNIKLPIAANGGLIHLGNVPLFIGAILFGKQTGASQAVSEWDYLIYCPDGLHGHHLLL